MQKSIYRTLNLANLSRYNDSKTNLAFANLKTYGHKEFSKYFHGE